MHFDECTDDPVFRGRMMLLQPRDGYRYSIDPFLLADFVKEMPGCDLLDIGAGVGVLGLSVALHDEQRRVTCVELQPRLSSICGENIQRNHMESRCRVLTGNISALVAQKNILTESFDGVVSCPPYYRVGTGHMNPNGEEALARHELMLSLKTLVLISKKMVPVGGWVSYVYPSARFAEMCGELLSVGLRPVRARFVHSKPGQPAQRVLLCAVKGSRSELVIESPLWVRDEFGRYTREVQSLLGEEVVSQREAHVRV